MVKGRVLRAICRLAGTATATCLIIAPGALLTACRTPTENATDEARGAGLAASVIPGAGFRHAIFFRQSRPDDTLYVFIEGDGAPWSGDGRRVRSDPTPHHALALQLAERSRHAVLYLGRPCYFGLESDGSCDPSLWTSGRYSERVVGSLVAAVNGFAVRHAYRAVVLVGYSGGGTLAVLMAPRMTSIEAVITVAANLDVAAWARWHGYLPLEASLNPADMPPLDPSIREWSLLGGNDANVPERISSRYLARLGPEQIWRFTDFDHVCCWVNAWPGIEARIDAALTGPSHP
jgi:hypothetical protein